MLAAGRLLMMKKARATYAIAVCAILGSVVVPGVAIVRGQAAAAQAGSRA